MKKREKMGLMMPKRYPTAVESITKATAAPAPASRLRAKASVLLRLPPGWKSAPGLNWRQMPVKEASNSSMGTFTSPRAGSLRRAKLPLKPSSTTKWLKFQWMMQGKRPFSWMALEVMR